METLTAQHLPDKKLVTWKDKGRDIERLERNLRALMDTIVIEKAKAVSHEGFKLEAIVYVLSSLIGLHGITNASIKNGIITQACFRLRTCKKQDAATFRRVLAAGVRRHLRLAEHPYRIVFPLNIDSRSLERRRWFATSGLRFSIRSWPYVKRHLALDDWLRQAKLIAGVDERSLHHSFTPLEVIAPDRGPRESFDEACTAFELLRSVLNLEVFGSYYSIQFGVRKPLGKIMPPPVYGVFNEDGGFETLYVEERPPRKYDQPRIQPDRIRQADRLLRQLSQRHEPRSTIGLVEEAIRKYGRALDTTNWRDAFLSLWQVLELLTHEPNTTYKMWNVCERASTLLQTHPLMVDILYTCYQTRNALVHRGRFSDEGLIEVGMLKIIVERCIDAVYGLGRACPDWHSLVVYYQNAAMLPDDLTTRVRVIRSIQRMKTASTKKAEGKKGTGKAPPAP